MGAVFPSFREASGGKELLVFKLNDQRYGLSLSAVERVIRMVEIAALHHAPESVLGLVNIEGEIVPVFDIRHRFGHESLAADPDHQLILARTSKRRVALAVDRTLGVETASPGSAVDADEISLPHLNHVAGVVKHPDGMIFIHDLESFLSTEEGTALDAALSQI